MRRRALHLWGASCWEFTFSVSVTAGDSLSKRHLLPPQEDGLSFWIPGLSITTARGMACKGTRGVGI